MRAKRITVVAVLALLCVSACSKRPRVVVAPPPPPPPALAPLELADRAFNSGAYYESARGY